MIEVITKKRINNIYLKDKKEISQERIDDVIYYYELNDNKEIITLSVRKVYDLKINDITITFDNLYSFIEKNDHKKVDNIYYFFNLNLNLFINFEKKFFYEILIYADSVSHFYK